MATMKQSLQRFDKWTDEAFRLLSLCIFGDVIYAALPLVVLASISIFLNEPLENFFELKEWSFATIVLIGVVIRRFIRVKVHIQQRANSYKLDSGVQLFIVLLIVSVLVLALVVLAEMHRLPEHILKELGIVQVQLFLFALAGILFATIAEDKGLNWSESLGTGVTRLEMLELSLRELVEAERLARYVLVALDKPKQLSPYTDADSHESLAEEAKLSQNVALVLTQMEQSITHIHRNLAESSSASDVRRREP